MATVAGYDIAAALTIHLNAQATLNWPEGVASSVDNEFVRVHLVSDRYEGLDETRAEVVDLDSEDEQISRSMEKVETAVAVFIARRISDDPAESVTEGDKVKRFASEVRDACRRVDLSALSGSKYAGVKWISSSIGSHAISEHLREQNIVSTVVTVRFLETVSDT